MKTVMRYLNLWASLAKFSLLGEMAFRGNFVVKVFVELIWLAILLLFNFTLFKYTQEIAEWNQHQYLFFLGCYFAMAGLLEMLFLSNCNEFAELIRTGDLDFFLLKPVDEQFMVSCRNVDWSCAPNVLLGGGVCVYALWGTSVPWTSIPLFLAMFICGVAMAYGFLLMLTAASVWFMRNQSLMEMWWLFGTLMRYPREIFLQSGWVKPIGIFFSTVIPIMLVTNVPARIIVGEHLEPWPWSVPYLAVATGAVLWVSRLVFRAALRRYRSASS